MGTKNINTIMKFYEKLRLTMEMGRLSGEKIGEYGLEKKVKLINMIYVYIPIFQ